MSDEHKTPEVLNAILELGREVSIVGFEGRWRLGKIFHCGNEGFVTMERVDVLPNTAGAPAQPPEPT